MILHTARYGNKNVATSGALPITISLGKPRYPVAYEFRHCVGLAPRREWFKLEREAYTERYLAKIERLGVDGVMELIRAAADFDDQAIVVLLCFEDLRIEGKWCHRRILGEWLEGHGIACTELHESPSRTYEKSKQLSMWGES